MSFSCFFLLSNLRPVAWRFCLQGISTTRELLTNACCFIACRTTCHCMLSNASTHLRVSYTNSCQPSHVKHEITHFQSENKFFTHQFFVTHFVVFCWISHIITHFTCWELLKLSVIWSRQQRFERSCRSFVFLWALKSRQRVNTFAMINGMSIWAYR